MRLNLAPVFMQSRAIFPDTCVQSVSPLIPNDNLGPTLFSLTRSPERRFVRNNSTSKRSTNLSVKATGDFFLWLFGGPIAFTTLIWILEKFT